MALGSGTKLGPYEILAPLGAGGMGEVYRARDTKLGREVALKVLPEAFARDHERMARFQREAQVLASLNHPNIASIYGLEDSAGARALVMELVEGPTLADRLKAGAMPPEEALPIAGQIAEGLEYAHERGVMHRDLKPANVKVRPDGTVKILDFGLAKALSPQESGSGLSPTNSPTLSVAATQAGVILGTAAYMSPEQAKGKSADRRADIWAFGCVLYEMLSGGPTFEGETTTDVLAAVVRAEPDWSRLPAATPPRIQGLLRRCLIKDPKQRLQAIGEARITIAESLANPEPGETAATPPSLVVPSEVPSRQSRQSAVVLLATTAALILGLAAGWWLKGGSKAGAPAWSGQMLGGPGIAMGPRISPDGHTLAFQAMVDGLTQVAVMDTESGDWTVLTKNRSHGYVTELNWSLDGAEVYFDRQYAAPRGVYAVSRFGGDERLLLEDAVGPEVLPDGSLLVTRVNKDRDFQLYRFWPESGRIVPLNGIIRNVDLCPPVRAFRDGKEALFFGRTLDQAATDRASYLYALELSSGKARRLAAERELAPSALSFFPLAVSVDDKSVLIDLREGDLHRVVEVPRSGSAPLRSLLSLTSPPLFMDVGKDGTLYLDQAVRPSEILRFSALGGTPEIQAGSESAYAGAHTSIEIKDGRVVISSIVAGRSRLLAAKPGGDEVPLIATKEDTWEPICPVGKSEIAFLLGPQDHKVLAIADISDGRIVRRLKGVQESEITSLVASPDGTTLYYVASRTVWAIPVSDGQPRRIVPGDAVTTDPDGKDLIVQLNEKEGSRLVRVPASGGTEQPITLLSALSIAPVNLAPNAIGKDGRALMTIASPDSWFYGAAILDLRSGKVDRIPVNFGGDLLGLAWQSDGRIICTGWPIRDRLWRFRPVAQENK